MRFIKVEHSLNMSYFVEDFAIKDMVFSAFEEIQKIKLKKIEVYINKENNGYELCLHIQKDKEKSFFEATKEIERVIEDFSENLVSIKPDNIEMIFD